MKIVNTVLFFIVLSIFSANAFSKEVKSVDSKSFALKSGGAVTIAGDEGYITVRGWEKDEVALTITKVAWHRNSERANELLQDIEIDIRHTENRLSIREVNRDRNHFRFSNFFDAQHGDYRIDYDLKVPREVDLKIESDEGDVHVEEIQGQLRLNVDEGEVRLIKLKSVKAYVNIDEGDLFSEASSGENSELYVTIDEGEVSVDGGYFTRLDIDTDEGEVFLRALSVSNCDLNSDEGDLDVRLDIIGAGDCRLKTDEGDISVQLPATADVELYARVYEGRIRTNFDSSVREQSDEGESLDITLGAGTAKLKLISEEGSISITKPKQ